MGLPERLRKIVYVGFLGKAQEIIIISNIVQYSNMAHSYEGNMTFLLIDYCCLHAN